MDRLRVHLLKHLEVSVDGGPPLDLGSPTTQHLFAYLVLNYQQTIDRRRLAFLFWPRGTEAAARRNLRQYLHRLRRALEPVDPEGQLISTEGNSLRFCPPNDWYLDANAFEAAANSDESLEAAVHLYAGDLLEEIYEDWLVPERERLRRVYQQTLLRLIGSLEGSGQYSEAIVYAQRYLDADPLLESAHLRLMRLYYAVGDRLRVKQQYQQLTRWLAEELGAEPLTETTIALEAMLAGDYDNLEPATSRPTHIHPSLLPSPKSEQAPPRLVGRADELAWLNQAFAAAEASQGSFRLIQGESGVGKTRLVTEWLGSIQTFAYLFSGRGHEFESMLAYAPLAEALQNAVEEQEIPWDLFRPAPPWLGALEPLLPGLQTYIHGLEAITRSAVGKHHIVEGLGNFFLTLARHRPVIIFIDNLHWAAPPTWNFLGYLAQRVVQTRLLIIAAARPEDTSPERSTLIRTLQHQGNLSKLRLERLSQNDTQILVRDLMTNEDIDPRFVRRIYEETEGNPFFIIETIRAVREAGGDWTQSVPTDEMGRRPALAIPLQVQAVIESRLDKLSEESRAALGVAAALGREFSFQLLQDVSQTPTEALLDALDEWLARDLVREIKDGYDFTHEKLSQVAYDQLSRARRQWIHLRVANFLEANAPATDPAKLAHHYYLSSEPALALPYLTQAGERALSVRSYDEAREFGLRAVGLLGRFPNLKQSQKIERLDLNLQLAQAHAFTGALPKALKILQEAEHLAETLGDMSRLAHIFLRSARVFWLRGDAKTASDYARRVLRHAEELDEISLRFAALRMLGRTGIVLSQYDDAIALLLRYIDLSEKESQQADLSVIYGYLGVAYARVGSWQRAIDAAQKGLELASVELLGATHAVARMQLAFVYAELREWPQSLIIAEPVRDLWHEEGMSPHAFMLRSVIGRSLVHTGSHKEGVAEIEAALKWSEDVDFRVLIHLPLLSLAQCLYKQEQYQKALDVALQAAEISTHTGDQWAVAVALRTQAEISMRLPQPDWARIEDKLIRSRDILRQIRARPDLARTYLALRRLYDRAGQAAWAVDCHFRVTTIFDELGMVNELQAAQGQAAGERAGAVVIPNLNLRGPNVLDDTE
jgi:DNA-binding SARP family transcriptional activator